MKNTVNESEIEKFSKLSDTWWSPDSGFKTLHAMNSIRVPLIESTLDNNTKGEKKRILDIGCGGGFLSEGLAEKFHNLGWSDNDVEIFAMDPSFANITVAKTHLPTELKGKVSYVCDTIENFVTNNPFALFDTVVMSEVIEHVENPEEFLKYAVSVVKPGGSVILTTPARTFMSWFGVIFCAEHLLGLVPVGTHEYNKFIALENCKRMFIENECEIKDIRGAFYNPMTNRWSWSIFGKMFCYAIHAVKK